VAVEIVMNKAVFIDKDGTLIHDVPYNVNPDLITLSEGAGEALRRFKAAGYLLVVISNQAGIAKGLFEEAALEGVQRRLGDLLSAYGIALNGFYYCPHYAQGTVARYARACNCRKPKPGMLLAAAHDLNIDLEQSWMIGDIAADSEAGRRAGCRTILIEKPYDPILKLTLESQPDYLVHQWAEVAAIILGTAAASGKGSR
jgi:D-glycero-D-manno-heptose 1,7-bisphosphate phosphatase